MAKIDLAAAFDTSNLDQNNPGSWPIGIQGLTFLAIFIAIIAAGIWFENGPYRPIILLQEDLKKSEQKLEKELKPRFESKAALAANLEAYKAQLAEMERSFGAMLSKLPEELQIDALIIDISQAGLRAGLEFDLIKPGGELAQEFYVEFPINITVVGKYHEFGDFVSGLSELNRIVSVHDVKLKGDGTNLTMTMVAKTYRAKKESEG
jgi:type IV pilus assembly protein PilO